MSRRRVASASDRRRGLGWPRLLRQASVIDRWRDTAEHHVVLQRLPRTRPGGRSGEVKVDEVRVMVKQGCWTTVVDVVDALTSTTRTLSAPWTRWPGCAVGAGDVATCRYDGEARRRTRLGVGCRWSERSTVWSWWRQVVPWRARCSTRRRRGGVAQRCAAAGEVSSASIAELGRVRAARRRWWRGRGSSAGGAPGDKTWSGGDWAAATAERSREMGRRKWRRLGGAEGGGGYFLL
jgi:hypothetical protein